MKNTSIAPYIDAQANLGILGVVAVFFLSVLIQIVGYDTRVNMYDEGIILTGASSIVRGDLPYRDFWSMYGPGQFYLLSWLFQLVGESNLALRCIGIFSKASIAVFAFMMISRLHGGRGRAWLGSFAVLCMLVAFRQDGFPVFPALALLMASILLAEYGLRRGGVYLFASGCLAGLASLFRHDLGAYGGVAMTCALCVFFFSSGRPIRGWAGAFSRYAGGFAVVAVPAVGALLCYVPLKDLVENLLIIPSSIYPENRRLPWPSLSLMGLGHIKQLLVYVPFLVGGVAALIIVRGFCVRCSPERSATRLDSVRGFLLPVTAISCLLFTLKGSVRVEPLHMSQSLVLAVPLMISAWHLATELRGRVPKFACRFIVVMCIFLTLVPVASGAAIAASGVKSLLFSKNNLVSKCLESRLHRAPCMEVDPDYASVASFLEGKALPGEHVYVGVGRHDRIFVNAVALYFLLDLSPATKWAELHPGVQTQDRIQRAMVGEFEMRRPRFAVLDSRWDRVSEPNASSLSSGVNVVDEYIKNNYSAVYVSGTVQVLMRN